MQGMKFIFTWGWSTKIMISDKNLKKTFENFKLFELEI